MKLEQKFQNCSLALTLDVWSGVKKDTIQAVTFHSGTESFLLKVYDSWSQKKTAEKYASVVEEAIEECSKKLHINVFAVVTDTKNKTTKMWDILKEKYPDHL